MYGTKMWEMYEVELYQNMGYSYFTLICIFNTLINMIRIISVSRCFIVSERFTSRKKIITLQKALNIDYQNLIIDDNFYQDHVKF